MNSTSPPQGMLMSTGSSDITLDHAAPFWQNLHPKKKGTRCLRETKLRMGNACALTQERRRVNVALKCDSRNVVYPQRRNWTSVSMRLPSHQGDLHEMNGATIVLIVWESDNQMVYQPIFKHGDSNPNERVVVTTVDIRRVKETR